MKGTLWWIADSELEAEEWKSQFEGAGAHVEIHPHGPDDEQHDVLITLEREDAKRILGYVPNEEEWLEE